jgi:virginiamycin B lyase
MREKTIRHRILVPVYTTLLLFLVTVRAVEAAGSPSERSLGQRERYGFVASMGGWTEQYDVAQLGAGWYVNFANPTCDASLGGMMQAQVLRTSAGQSVDADSLGPMVDSYPGTLWLIGNEPDSPWQDNVLPEEYARIYHDMYTFIRGRDPTSRVSPGGIVQPTPLRLAYLDRVLAEYDRRYGASLPVDVWNIHNAILNEVSCAYDPDNCWGAEIPPGIDATVGEMRAIDDNDDMTIFADQIRAFRQWMVDRGYGGYPLIISEYGVLMPEIYGFGVDRVNAFMSATFEFLETAQDPTLGDPDDENRLVQRWAWFSLDTPPWNPVTGGGFNGNLFDPDTGTITAFGQHYASRTSTLPPLAYVDLRASGFHIQPAASLASASQTISRSLEVQVANGGTVDAGSFWVSLTYDGPLSGSLEATISNVASGQVRGAAFTLPDLLPGAYEVTAVVDSSAVVVESLECNNRATTTLLAPTDRLCLPVTANHNGQAAIRGGGGRRKAGSNKQEREVQSVNLRAGSFSRQALGSGFREFEVPTAGSYPAQIALDTAGRVWISERDGNQIARFDPQGQTWAVYGIPTPDSQPWGITLDAEGNVWFAETAANEIGKLDVTSGEIREYGIPTADSEPWEVAVERGGAIWFTERAGGKIGKLVPSQGAVTAEYPLAAGSVPTGIAVYGHYVWFTDAAGDKIARLDSTTGNILERTRPAGSAPQDLVVTSVGVPWFTEMEANRIVQFDPSTLSWGLEVEVATPNSKPFGITMEGSVAVWFTEWGGNKLGRFSGRIPPREFSLPSPNSLPTDIVVDGTGCAWYTAPGANRIGQFCPIYEYVYMPLVVGNESFNH